MSGIKISRSAAAVVHAEGPGGGDSATLCGKGADYIHATREEVGCKSCLRKLAIVAQAEAEEATLARVNAPSKARMAEIHAGAQAPTWGTWKSHGKARELRFYGRTLGYPASTFHLVTIETVTSGTALEIRSLTSGNVLRVGVATRFYAAPTTLDELKANTDQILQTVARERQEAREAATVITTGNRIHADGAPCGTVYDDDLISGVDTEDSADCLACLSQPMERIAGDGSMIRVGSRVIVSEEGTSDGSTPTGIVTSLAYYEGGEWVPLVTVEHVEGGLPYGYYAEHLATVPAGAMAHVVTSESGCKAVFPCCGQRSEWYATQRFANGAVKHHECVTACADLVTDHEAESHSRRGRECRICGGLVTDHESVKITDGVAVAWWTGTVVDPGAVLNPERVALVEARREAARIETPVKTDAEWAEDLRRAAIRDGVYRHIMGQPPVNPAIYGSDQVAALAHVHAWLTGHWGCECTGYGPNGGKLVYLLTGIEADHAEALAMVKDGATVVSPECVNCGRDLMWAKGALVEFRCPWGRCLPPQDRATAVSSAPESPSDQTGGEAASVDSEGPFQSIGTQSLTGDDLSMIDDADDLSRFIAAGRQSLTGTAWRVRPGASKRKIHKGR